MCELRSESAISAVCCLNYNVFVFARFMNVGLAFYPLWKKLLGLHRKEDKRSDKPVAASTAVKRSSSVLPDAVTVLKGLCVDVQKTALSTSSHIIFEASRSFFDNSYFFHSNSPNFYLCFLQKGKIPIYFWPLIFLYCSLFFLLEF